MPDPSPTPPSLSVFLSYSTADVETVRQIEKLLAEVDIETWFDRASLVGGQPWQQLVETALADTDLVVACVSPRALERKGFFLEEVALARRLAGADADLDIVPLRLAETPLPETIADLHWVDFFVETGPDLLLAALRYHAEKRGRRPIPDVPALVARLPAARGVDDSWETGEPGHVVATEARLVEAGSHRRARAAPLLWGDGVGLLDRKDGRVEVATRSGRYAVDAKHVASGASGLLRIELLELGAGCAALVTAPDGRRLLFNAGFGDYACRYLQWRCGGPVDVAPLDAIILGQSDELHGEGLRAILESGCFEVGSVFHNGVVPRRPPEKNFHKLGKRKWVTPVHTEAELRQRLAQGTPGAHALLLALAADSDAVGEVRSLGRVDGFVPGFGPDDGEPTLEVLWPAPGKKGLEFLGSLPQTIRGHSIVLRLTFGKVRILLRGEMHEPGEQRLLEEYADDFEGSLAVDLARLCYHGSKNFSEDLIKAMFPAGAVVGMGRRPSLPHFEHAANAFARRTDPGAVMRTGVENLAFAVPAALRGLGRQLTLYEERAAAPVAAHLPEPSRARYLTALDRFGSYLAAHHVVHLRTDGERALLARPSLWGDRWDLRRFRPATKGPGRLAYDDR